MSISGICVKTDYFFSIKRIIFVILWHLSRTDIFRFGSKSTHAHEMNWNRLVRNVGRKRTLRLQLTTTPNHIPSIKWSVNNIWKMSGCKSWIHVCLLALHLKSTWRYSSRGCSHLFRRRGGVETHCICQLSSKSRFTTRKTVLHLFRNLNHKLKICNCKYENSKRTALQLSPSSYSSSSSARRHLLDQTWSKALTERPLVAQEGISFKKV